MASGMSAQPADEEMSESARPLAAAATGTAAMDCGASKISRTLEKLALDSPAYAAMRARGVPVVDKTGSVADLLNYRWGDAHRVFFSRPRKFGKSFTLDVAAKMLAAGTLPAGVAPWPGYESVDIEALFGGTEVHRHLQEEPAKLHGLLQKTHFVVHLDLSGVKTGAELEGSIQRQLAEIGRSAFASDALKAEIMSAPFVDAALCTLVHAVPEGVPVALLVDDFDRAILKDVSSKRWEAAHDGMQAVRALLGGTRQPGLIDRVERCLVTGAARFTRTSIFSLITYNNIDDMTTDLTDDPVVSRVMGFTREEVRRTFPGHLRRMAETSLGATGDPVEAALDELQKWHGGLCFDGKTSLLDPYPVLSALDAGHITTTEVEGVNWMGLSPSDVLLEAFGNARVDVPRWGFQGIVRLRGTEEGSVHATPLLLHAGLLSRVPGAPDTCRPPNECARRSLQRMLAASLR